MRLAPRTGPTTVPAPPITTISKNMSDKLMPNESGDTTPVT